MNTLSDADQEYIANQIEESLTVIQRDWVTKYCDLKDFDRRHVSAVVGRELMLHAFMLFGQSLQLEFEPVHKMFKETIEQFRILRGNDGRSRKV